MIALNGKRESGFASLTVAATLYFLGICTSLYGCYQEIVVNRDTIRRVFRKQDSGDLVVRSSREVCTVMQCSEANSILLRDG